MKEIDLKKYFCRWISKLYIKLWQNIILYKEHIVHTKKVIIKEAKKKKKFSVKFNSEINSLFNQIAVLSLAANFIDPILLGVLPSRHMFLNN